MTSSSVTLRVRARVAVHLVLAVAAPLLYGLGALADHTANRLPTRSPRA